MDNDFDVSDDINGHHHTQQQHMLQHLNGESMLYPTSIGPTVAGESPNAVSNRSPLQLRQSSPFPMESTNSRRIHYVNPQERLRSSGKCTLKQQCRSTK